MNSISVILLAIILLTSIGVIYNFIKDMRRHQSRMRNLDEWSKFHEQLIIWSKEIVDINIRVNFLNECSEHLMYKRTKDIPNLSVKEDKMRVFEKWGKHIPSLTQEIRETKLNDILN